MRNSIYSLALVCVIVAVGSRWSCLAEGPASPEPPGTSQPAQEPHGVGVLTCRWEGDSLIVTLRNEGTGGLSCKASTYDGEPPQVEDINIILKTVGGAYVAPIRGCGTGRRDHQVELPPGESTGRWFTLDPQAALELQIQPRGDGPLVAEVEALTPTGQTTIRSEPFPCPR